MYLDTQSPKPTKSTFHLRRYDWMSRACKNYFKNCNQKILAKRAAAAGRRPRDLICYPMRTAQWTGKVFCEARILFSVSISGSFLLDPGLCWKDWWNGESQKIPLWFSTSLWYHMYSLDWKLIYRHHIPWQLSIASTSPSLLLQSLLHEISSKSLVALTTSYDKPINPPKNKPLVHLECFKRNIIFQTSLF